MTFVLPQQTAWADRANVCLQEALDSVRTKDIRSTTLERPMAAPSPTISQGCSVGAG